MKRIMCFLMVLCLLLPLIACGGNTETLPTMEIPVETAAPTTEPTAAPTTEPTLSPEEQLLASLPERTRQAYALGLVALEQLEELERKVTVGEAAGMLQRAYVHRTGVESELLAEMMTSEQYAPRNATRGWLMCMPALAEAERLNPGCYTGYQPWAYWCYSHNTDYAFWWSLPMRNSATVYTPVAVDFEGWGNKYAPDTVYDEHGGYYTNDWCADIVGFASDWEALLESQDEEYCLHQASGVHISYAFRIYDSTTGYRFMELEDGMLNYTRELTMGEMVEHALRYYHYPDPLALPTFVAPEEVGTYNPDIITAELLTKETSLPEASCAHLPSQWHGVVMDDMQQAGKASTHLDQEVYEYEIQAVKDAGFNYIGLNLDFSYLQDYGLFAEGTKKTYSRFVNAQDEGKFSLERLEKLDQVIAWCMERDIHVNLRCTGLGYTDFSKEMFTKLGARSKEIAARLATMWQAIARRYADIPNAYLSFTLLTDAGHNNAFLLPSIESIREVSPDRCLIAEICNWKLDSEEFAKLGVALSYQMQSPEEKILKDNFLDLADTGYWKDKGGHAYMTEEGKRIIADFDWPYNGQWDVKALFQLGRYRGESCMDVIETAQEYGVGFMLGNFGVENAMNFGCLQLTHRYADTPYHAMITDVVSTMEELGYGWCFYSWFSPYGIAFCVPIIEDTTYVQVGDYPYYIDQTTLGWFQEINGVA